MHSGKNPEMDIWKVIIFYDKRFKYIYVSFSDNNTIHMIIHYYGTRKIQKVDHSSRSHYNNIIVIFWFNKLLFLPNYWKICRI